MRVFWRVSFKVTIGVPVWALLGECLEDVRVWGIRFNKPFRTLDSRPMITHTVNQS